MDTILFLCPHNAAKSVLAAAYFDQMARAEGLSFRADSGGTEPSEAVAPAVVAMLREEGIDVSGFQPHKVTSADLNDAARIISMGCANEDLEVDPARVEQWTDIPAVSASPQEAQAVIRQRVAELVSGLKA